MASLCRSWLTGLWAIGLVLALAGGVQAAEYYVSTQGSDSAAGNASAPWATLQHAVENVSAGDTIWVRAGTYAGCRIQRSGTENAPITLRAEEGASVLINSPGAANRHQSGIELETWEGDGTVSWWVIQGLEVANVPGWGIDLRASEERHTHHITVRDNRVHHCGLERGVTGIFTAFVDDALIEGNESYANGEHGIYLSNSGDRSIVRGNRLYDNVGCGLHMNGDESMGGDGIISGVLAENNRIYGNGSEGGAAINNDGVEDSTFRNNLIYGNHAGGIAVFQGNGAICSRNNRYLNNTIIQPSDGRWAINIAGSACTGNHIQNNIILSDHSFRGAITIPTPRVSGLVSDYNIVVSRFTADDGENVIDLGAWQGLGYDAHSRVASAGDLFVNPGGQDYRLKAGSPAIDAGTNLDTVTSDIEGTSRPQGAGTDVGAYEYSDGQTGGGNDSPVTTPSTGGHITYTLPDRTLYRIAASENATPENISAALDALSPRQPDYGLNISPDGQWLVLRTERFDPDCQGWACLALVKGDLSAGWAVRSQGALVRPAEFCAVASGGELIVYPGKDGPHSMDLFAIRKQGDDWSAPVLLTGASPYAYHELPAISDDGAKVVFNVNQEPYALEGSMVAEVGTDGNGFRVITTPADSPAGLPNTGSLHGPDYAPDGSIVVESDWQGEQIWRVGAGGGTPSLVTNLFHNDNSPCVLPDGRIASLWMNRPGASGIHELKVMNADGSGHFMVLIDVDILDAGMGCGR